MVNGELVMADCFGGGELSTADGDHQPVEILTHRFLCREAGDDRRRREIEVIGHLRDRCGVGADLHDGLDGVAKWRSASGGEDIEMRPARCFRRD